MKRLAFITMLLTLATLASTARAAEVRFEVSSREAYVGSTIQLKVTVADDGKHEPPDQPEVVNGQIASGPHKGDFSSMQWVNGRMTRSSQTTYSWNIRPRAAGRMIVTPPVVVAEGERFSGETFIIKVLDSDAGDLLFTEVDGPSDGVFLGEPIDLRLRIWIKPFRNRRYKLDEGDMWRRVDFDQSSWGAFLPRLQELAEERRRPKGREVTRPDSSGQIRTYFLYELAVTHWPERAGAFDPGDVSVVVDYPLQLRRDVFEIRVVRSRPVIGVPEPPDTLILSPPEAGRPPWFNDGAVGRFDFDVTARPTDVAVGDPITITMNIRDLTGGRGQLEVLQPPPLARVEKLTEQFRMPSDPLAGQVTGNSKRFSQTLRARSEQVTQIPALPFAYFDPEQEKFVTVHSAPIDVTVAPGAVLSMTDVVGGEAGGVAPTELTEVNTGLLANAMGETTLLASATVRPPAWWGLVLGLPPLVFVGVVITRRRAHRVRHDRRWVRQRRARRDALKRVGDAGAVSGDEQAHLVSDAIGGYVADRCNLPAGAVTRAEVVRTLRAGDVAEDLVAEVEDLLAAGEAARYAGGAAAGNGDLVQRARGVIDRLERERIR